MARSQTQIPFSLFNTPLKSDFGGSLKKSHPKTKRPISTKKSMHVVLRSSHARGEHSFLRAARARRIRKLIEEQAEAFGIKLYRYANSGNHLHLLVLPRTRRAFIQFMRTISGLIARLTLGAERGSAQELQFWDARPFSRFVEWGREYNSVADYLLRNTLEALGFIAYKPRKALAESSV